MKFPGRGQIEELRRKYPAGTKVEVIFMDDCQAPPPGTLGEIQGVDDAGSILVAWKTGSTLSLIAEVDRFRIVKEDGQDG